MVQAWRRATSPVPGPVHINVPYRDPLEPTVVGDGVRRGFLGPARRFFHICHLQSLPGSERFLDVFRVTAASSLTVRARYLIRRVTVRRSFAWPESWAGPSWLTAFLRSASWAQKPIRL